MEFNAYADAPLEVKRMEVRAAEGDGDSASVGVFEGYASTFGNTDRYGDIIKSGAFKSAVQEPIPMLWQHRMDMPIGVFTEWKQDRDGLYVVGEINLETQQGKDAYGLLKAGHLRTMSVGFISRRDRDDGENRIIEEAELVEISLVTIPANPKAVVTTVKSAEDVAAWRMSCMTGTPFPVCRRMLQSAVDDQPRATPAADVSEEIIKRAAALRDDLKAIVEAMRG